MSVELSTIEHMFDTVIGPRMRVTDETVMVWMSAGLPARLVYRLSRWRVEGTPTPIIEVPEEQYHPLITHPRARQTGWLCTVRQVDSGDTLTLRLRHYDHAWMAEEVPGS